MFRRRLVAFSGFLLLSGCLYHSRQNADQTVCDLLARPFDLPPTASTDSERATRSEANASAPASSDRGSSSGSGVKTVGMDVEASKMMLEVEQAQPPHPGPKPRLDLNIPREVPGSEAPRIELPKEQQEKKRAIEQLYQELPPLPTEPIAVKGPDGNPYTLADLQRLAGANSPTLRQAASDVEAAKGNLLQARTYPNPTVGYEIDPSNDGSTPSTQGVFVDQPIKTGGKLKLAAAAAEMDLRNAELALRRARSDLATNVRNAYFALIVAKETVRVNKALARFTDEVYRLQATLLSGGFAAAYEPAALRAQAYTARLALKQSIGTYTFAWKQLTAVIGLRQLPLTEVAGRIDAAIPYYDFDAALAQVLRNHTDLLTARNGIEKARYNLLLAQVTPAFPDLDIRFAVLKDYASAPKQFSPSAQIGLPFPIWDLNKGNIMAAESALMRSTEEPHRVETSLSNNFAAAYVGYKNNLQALEYYRRYILPDQVRAYRGAYARRQIDPNAAFGDLVQAQQTLAANVTTYLTILGQLWSSVVSVADFLQTDDLFQNSQPKGVPELPDLEQMPPLPCCHDCTGHAPSLDGANCGTGSGCPPAAELLTVLPALTPVSPGSRWLKGYAPNGSFGTEPLPVPGVPAGTALNTPVEHPAVPVIGAPSPSENGR